MIRMDNERFLLSMLVNNEAGVLTRISGLFARRGFNIDSLSVGETEDPGISRITIMAKGDDYFKGQVVHQLEKLHDVNIVELMDLDDTVMRELLLIKIKAQDQTNRSQILEAVNIFRAKVIDLTPVSLTVEITGETLKVQAFVEYLTPYGILELCRTGVTAIGRGTNILSEKYNENKGEM
ncbi:MAG: acetolactate synthase small subunit [Clostridiales bacterium]|nr:acetolactate synthase small subunit [Clostridiales bacterium]